MSKASFQVIYDGPALSGSTIDVRDLAPALLALGEVIEQANLTVNTDHAKVSLRVNASFKSGCFGIDFSVVQGLLDQALGLLAQAQVAKAKELVELLGFIGSAAYGLVGLIKWLRGRAIKEVVLLDNGRARIVVNGDQLEVEQRTIDLYRNHKLRVALEQAIAQPLDRDGFESVAIKTAADEADFVVVAKEERHYFRAPALAEEELEDRFETINLQLVSVSFRDENKWRFSDGATTFFATITDAGFLNRVRTGAVGFNAGDILRVSLRQRQWLAGDVMKSEFEVAEVLEHRKGMAQLHIPFRSGDA